MIDSLNYLRKAGTASDVYYGYSNNTNSSDSDSNWSIKRVQTTGIDETVTWSNGGPSNVSIWNNRVDSFIAPVGPLNVTYSVLNTPDSFNSNRKTLDVSWNLISGVDIYKVIINESGDIYSDGGYQIYNNPNFNESVTTGEFINVNRYRYTHAEPGLTYSVTVTGKNVAGTTSSTINITT